MAAFAREYRSPHRGSLAFALNMFRLSSPPAQAPEAIAEWVEFYRELQSGLDQVAALLEKLDAKARGRWGDDWQSGADYEVAGLRELLRSSNSCAAWIVKRRTEAESLALPQRSRSRDYELAARWLQMRGASPTPMLIVHAEIVLGSQAECPQGQKGQHAYRSRMEAAKEWLDRQTKNGRRIRGRKKPGSDR